MSISTYIPDDTKIIHKTKVDFRARLNNNTINLVQYDRVIPVLAIELYSNNNKYVLPDDANLEGKIRWGRTKTNQHVKDILGCNADRDVIYVTVDQDMTDIHGSYDAIIELVVPVNNTYNRMGSSPIKIVVDANPVQEMEA